MRRSSGAVSKLGKKLPVQNVVKPPSRAGTTVPDSGVETVATALPTRATLPSKDVLSHTAVLRFGYMSGLAGGSSYRVKESL